MDSRNARSCWPNHCARSVGPGFLFPTVYGLEDPDEGVTDWVFALPGGLAYIVSSNEEESSGVVHTSLDQIVRWWARSTASPWY